MSRRPPPIPTGLDPAGFTVAEAVGAGMTPRQLRRTSLVVPVHGARAVGRPSDLLATLRAFHLVLPPDHAFSHVTSAGGLHLPTPRPWGPEDLVDVMRPTGTPLVERAGARSHRGLEHRRVVRVHGLPFVDAVDTWVDLAGSLRLDDLVAVGDALLGGGVDEEVLRAAVGRADGRRGVRRLREAMALVRHGSASPMESKARVLFVGAGLPEPELNVDIWTEDGQWLSRPDFVWRKQKVVGEYDGDQHRTDRRVWQYERERRAGLEADGWTYVELTSLTLARPVLRDRLLRRLAQLLL